MITIYGKYTNAIVYTTENEQYAIDEYARKQLQMICDHPSAKGSKIRVMPDVHPGKVGTIGLTMTVGDSLLPNLVGVDIGCGMTLAKLKQKKIECQKPDTVIRENVPVGGKVRKMCHKFSNMLELENLYCYKVIDVVKAEQSIGTLGGGNADWNCSAPHGSGRIYKRSEVKEHHTVSEFRKAMEGIYSICINKDTLDESPFAYRSMEDMLHVIEETVTVDNVIKPVYNFKAG